MTTWKFDSGYEIKFGAPDPGFDWRSHPHADEFIRMNEAFLLEFAAVEELAREWYERRKHTLQALELLKP